MKKVQVILLKFEDEDHLVRFELETPVILRESKEDGKTIGYFINWPA